jgi:hypothetical protein
LEPDPALRFSLGAARSGSIGLAGEAVMSTTTDWVHGGQDLNRPSERPGLRLGGVISWVTAIAVTTVGVLALRHLYG